MATNARVASKIEQRAIVRFLMYENVAPIEIYRRMKNVYGDSVFSVQHVRKWFRKFKAGRESIADESREGRPISAATKTLEEKVDEMIRSDRKARLTDIATDLHAAYGTVQNIVKKKLKYRKICAHWIPHSLTAEQQLARRTACEQNLARFQKEGNVFLDHIVTGDETWCHYHIPTCKQASLTWKHKNSPRATKTKTKTSAGKVMMTLFFDVRGPLLIEWMPKGTTINAPRYVDTLMQLHKNIKNRRRGKLSAGVVLLHDNAKPHTAKLTQSILNTLNLEVLIHPPYSPDLSPCDYAVFGSLKKHLEGKRFSTDDEVKKAVKEWMLQVGAKFWRDVIYKLPQRWEKCIARNGDYVEH